MSGKACPTVDNAVAAAEAMSDDPPNPFLIPPDDEIFLMRDREKKIRQQERDDTKRLKVWQKTTASSRMGRVDKPLMSQMARESNPKTIRSRIQTYSEPPRRERENVSDYLSKKREMFLVQMSLDVKRNEIRKLEEKAKRRNEALEKSKQVLEEDITRFDKFLQANDALAHKAMKAADDLSKKKQGKTVKVKQLKAQLSVIESEITKLREQMEECLKYKTFLDKLTPAEWTAQQEEIKRQRKRQRRKAYIEKRCGEIDEAVAASVAEEEPEVALAPPSTNESGGISVTGGQRERRRRGTNRRSDNPTQEDIAVMKAKEMEVLRELQAFLDVCRKARRRRHRARHPDERQIAAYYDQEVAESSGEDLPLYFEKPKQLLEMFSTLEEQNLFLIQNGQETQQQLEDMEQRLQEAQGTLGIKARQLERENQDAVGRIDSKQRDCEKLKGRISGRSESRDIKGLLKELAVGVAAMFATCGFDADRDADPLMMLNAAEAKLEELLETLAFAEAAGGVLAETVGRMEREKEKERRDRVREEKIEAQNKKNEDRLRNSLLRSQAPIFKKCGKQIMFRSAPSREEAKEVADTAAEEHVEAISKLFGSRPPPGVDLLPPGKKSPRAAAKRKGK
ncbi:Coiled-coil domain containing [Perkinsus chesapeaki]|uniref:Coiled-coil domain containing n=1 Tax=Perkinsus chesapeaki TaxID=330153 RepID=A0A7J6LF44_PERCH|nr:Coiled-coil domain containing [Perkinsus chesapeaki]